MLDGHLHAEHGSRLSCAECGVFGNIERQGRLAHGRPSRDDDQIARLQASRVLVETREARWQPRDRPLGLVQEVQSVHRGVEHFAEADEPGSTPLTALANFKYPAFGLVHQLFDRAAFRPVRRRRDLVADLDQSPQQRPLANNAGVVRHIGSARGIGDQFSEVSGASRIGKLAARRQVLAKSDSVGRLAALGKTLNGIEDEAVIRAEKIRCPHQISNTVPAGVVQHDSAEQRLLGLIRTGGNRKLNQRSGVASRPGRCHGLETLPAA